MENNNYNNYNFNFKRKNVTNSKYSTSPTSNQISPKKNYKNIYCANCGERGHVVKDCERPITSFGIIAFKVVESIEDEHDDKNLYLSDLVASNSDGSSDFPKIKFLMIQRKDTIGFIDFVRGKYDEENEEEKNKLIQVLMNEMTADEKNTLLTQSFDDIWSVLWLSHDSKPYKNEYELAKKKYSQLDIPTLVEASENKYFHSEFGFAKGRRNIKESNIGCAEREFFEETGYNKTNYEFIKNYPMIEEEFVGTNGVTYRHIYYLVKMKNLTRPPCVDRNNKIQSGEVRNIGWFTIDECVSLLRPYDTAKKNVLTKVHNDISSMNFNFELSDFYIKNVNSPSPVQITSDPATYEDTENDYLYSNKHLIESDF
jgi:8-oxo-dGTP pyrophosphatase MutT (NUDIX family)